MFALLFPVFCFIFNLNVKMEEARRLGHPNPPKKTRLYNGERQAQKNVKCNPISVLDFLFHDNSIRFIEFAQFWVVLF